MRARLIVAGSVVATLMAFVCGACGAPSIDDGVDSDGINLPDRLPVAEAGDAPTVDSSHVDSSPADAALPDAGVDASVALDGTWTGTYTNGRVAFGCTFANAGNLTATYTTTGTAVTTTASVTGLELRDADCNVVGHTTGAAPASAVTSTAGSYTGTWAMNVQGGGGTLPFPFTAKVSGKTMTGTWTCTGCTGSFTLTHM